MWHRIGRSRAGAALIVALVLVVAGCSADGGSAEDGGQGEDARVHSSDAGTGVPEAVEVVRAAAALRGALDQEALWSAAVAALVPGAPDELEQRREATDEAVSALDAVLADHPAGATDEADVVEARLDGVATIRRAFDDGQVDPVSVLDQYDAVTADLWVLTVVGLDGVADGAAVRQLLATIELGGFARSTAIERSGLVLVAADGAVVRWDTPTSSGPCTEPAVTDPACPLAELIVVGRSRADAGFEHFSVLGSPAQQQAVRDAMAVPTSGDPLDGLVEVVAVGEAVPAGVDVATGVAVSAELLDAIAGAEAQLLDAIAGA